MTDGVIGEFRPGSAFGCHILRLHLVDGRILMRSWPSTTDNRSQFREAWWALMAAAS